MGPRRGHNDERLSAPDQLGRELPSYLTGRSNHQNATWSRLRASDEAVDAPPTLALHAESLELAEGSIQVMRQECRPRSSITAKSA